MELKQLNNIIILIAIACNISVFSQTKLADIENKEFSINLKKEKSNFIKISDDANYSIYYVFDKKDFDLKKGLGTNGIAKVIFFSKKYNKGIFSIFEQVAYREKRNVYNIRIRTGSYDKNMFVSSLAILDKDFNYEYFIKYYHLPPPPPDKGIYKSSFIIQDSKNYCRTNDIVIKGNLIYEKIDDILSSIQTLDTNKINGKECDRIINNLDFNDFFKK
ncbi:hypothetical protein BA768_19370 [Chryseobacterium sp. CBo1]|uniref:hypothetical protein n=1 Tax=Chryseobacterium sp. CBo1 TaxID=1869230 RepID=UPI0008103711|nr:hypothetical protein [Chryseobacterium sp. CBo1]OCK50677.1 hypothetical protein BA768_19370 [Chryseobacterium sp. CBo1]